jgi:hypothetical protein
MGKSKREISLVLPKYLKAFAPKKGKDIEGFFRSLIPELKEANSESIKSYLRNLTFDELLFLFETCRFPENNTKPDLSIYPIEVQTCLQSSNNFLLFKRQLVCLYILAGGKKNEATSFIRNWNKKNPTTRDGIAAEMHIGKLSLKQIIETLAYDIENQFIISEDIDFVQQVKRYIAIEDEGDLRMSCTSMTYIIYNGDINCIKRSDVSPKTKTHISIKSVNEHEFWISFMIFRKEGQQTFLYNLINEEDAKKERGIKLINPKFYQNRGSGKFFFTSSIEWYIEGKPEYFEFGASFRGELPSHIKAVDMI